MQAPHSKLGSLPNVIDCHYVRPKFACAYLQESQGHAYFVENNMAKAVPLLLDRLKQIGIAPEQVDYVIITHVHLDHAGGTSALLNACPNAKVLCHPRAKRHLVNPTKLVESAKKVYGEAAFESLYGTIEPIEESRISCPEDGEVILWQGRKLEFLYTEGHAKHHFCVLDHCSNGIYTGDSFGLAYPALEGFIFPSTSPTDYDPQQAKRSIERIVSTGAKYAYLTHFGIKEDLPKLAQSLLEILDLHEGVYLEARDRLGKMGVPQNLEALTAECQTQLRDRISTKLGRFNHREELIRSYLTPDLELNGAGLAWAAAASTKK